MPMARGGTSEATDRVQVPKQTRRLFLAVALLTLAVYLVTARGLPQTFDEQIIYDTTSSLAHGHATINTPLLKQFDLAVKRSDGKRAGIYGIGTSAVGVPLYAVGKAVAAISPANNRAQIVLTATMFTDAFITAAAVFMLMLVCFLLGAPPPGAVLVGLSFGLGSYAYPHALTLFTEPGTALCVIAAVYYAIRAARGATRRDLIVCGAFAGGALLFRVSAALFVPLFGLWLLLTAWRRVGSTSPRLRRVFASGAWFTAGAIGPLLVVLATNAWRYGSPTNFGYALGTATSQSYPIVRGAWNQWFSSGKSVFLFAPVAVIAVAGLARSFRKLPMEMGLLAALVIVNTLFFARVQFWSGDWAWGPRYLQIVIPCVAAMAAPLMDSPQWRRALLAVSVLGLVFAALPAVLVRFTIIWHAAYAAMPPPSPAGPAVWDHSYYALVWHTAHWQQIGYQLRLLSDAWSNSLKHVTNPAGPTGVIKFPKPQLELWWLRARDLSGTAVFVFAWLPVVTAAAGARLLRTSRSSSPERPSDTLEMASESGS